MRINKYLITILITFSALSTIFSNSSNAVIIKNYTLEEFTDYNEFIIQFKQKSIVEFINQLKIRLKNEFFNLTKKMLNIFLNHIIQNYKNYLLSIHKNVKENISKFLESYDSINEIFLREYINLFNGISIKNVSYEFIQKIKNLPYIKTIFPNYKISATLDTSVPLINADDVWKIKDSFNRNITGKGVTIAILDTGVDYTHSDLKFNYIQQGSFDFVNNDTDPLDDYGHGTHCAGIICGNGNSSNFQYVGVAPDAKFFAIKILNQNGEGTFDTYLSGMEKAVDPNDDGDTTDHADIISLSFGTEEAGRPDDQFCKVVDNIVKMGVIVVSAAGNRGPESNTITSPGCALQSICVGSTDKVDVVALSSSRGPVEWDENYLVKPDIVAPGINIISTKNGGGYIIKSGTSMAVPHVAGAAALVLQANPDYTPEKVKQVLKENAKNLEYDSNIQGSGRLDVSNVFIEDTLYIDAPSEINESKFFRVKITDKNGIPVNALVLITFPLHVTRFKYGSSILFKAPIILLNGIETLKGKIRVLKIESNYEVYIKDILIVNKQ